MGRFTKGASNVFTMKWVVAGFSVPGFQENMTESSVKQYDVFAKAL
jgi:hypothetical protein